MPRPHDEFIKSLLMEIKSLKLTFNVQNELVVETVFNIIMKTIQDQPKASALTTAQLAVKIQKTLKSYEDLIKDFMGSQEDERVLVEEAELLCAKEEIFGSTFHVILQCMFKLELIKDSVIIEWGKEAKESIEKDEAKKKVSMQKNQSAVTPAHATIDKAKNSLGKSQSTIATTSIELVDDSISDGDLEEGEESDEILHEVGIEKRTKFYKDMEKFLEYLNQEPESSKSSSSSSSSESSSDDEDEKPAKDPEAKKSAAKAKLKKESSSSSSSSSSSNSEK